MDSGHGRLVVTKEVGGTPRNPLWSDFSFVASSGHREKVLRALLVKPRLPKQIAEDTSLRIAHVSRALRALRTRGLVECLTPEARAKGRLYGITPGGLALASFYASSSERYVPAPRTAAAFVPKVSGEYACLCLQYLRRTYGEARVLEALRGWSVNPAELSKRDWLSLDAVTEFLEMVEAKFGDGSYNFIRSLANRVAMGVRSVHAELAKVLPIEALVERAPIIWSKEWNYGRLEVRKGRRRASFLHFDWLPTPGLCATFQGVYEGVLRVKNLAGVVTEVRCVRRGDACCEFVMAWSGR